MAIRDQGVLIQDGGPGSGPDHELERNKRRWVIAGPQSSPIRIVHGHYYSTICLSLSDWVCIDSCDVLRRECTFIRVHVIYYGQLRTPVQSVRGC